VSRGVEVTRQDELAHCAAWTGSLPWRYQRYAVCGWMPRDSAHWRRFTRHWYSCWISQRLQPRVRPHRRRASGHPSCRRHPSSHRAARRDRWHRRRRARLHGLVRRLHRPRCHRPRWPRGVVGVVLGSKAPAALHRVANLAAGLLDTPLHAIEHPVLVAENRVVSEVRSPGPSGPHCPCRRLTHPTNGPCRAPRPTATPADAATVCAPIRLARAIPAASWWWRLTHG